MSLGDTPCRRIETRGGTIQACVIGTGPPLLLLHGFAQSRMMWGPVVQALADTHTLVIPDLPGYGDSDAPATVEKASKRAMAASLVQMMEVLGFAAFDLAGHDRGGRVAYRMALDHPQCVTRLAVLDILPTSDYWDKMDRAFALKIYHWAFLAQPYPLPETMIGGEPDFWLEWTLKSWTMARSLDCFDPDAMAHYRHNFHDPSRLKAMCDDYRAGATVDVEHDLASRKAGQKIEAPTLVLWGASGIAQSAETPLEIWRTWCRTVEGTAIRAGHFLPEENPADTGAALARFFA